MTATSDRFPYFWEVETPAGAENWWRMYPSYLISQEENRELEEGTFWVQGAMHHPRAVFPFDSIVIEGISLAAGQNNTRVFTVPAALGMRERISNGYRYMSPVEISDQSAIAQRTKDFQQRAGHYYANWDEISANWERKVKANIAATQAIEIGPLPDVEDLQVVTSGRGTSSGYELVDAYNRLISNFFRMWQYHFEMTNISHAAFGAFSMFCRSAFPGTTPQTLARMVAGQDLLLYRPDDELKRLAKLAIDLGVVEEIRSAVDAEDPLGAIDATDAGRRWTAELREIADPWFYYADNGNLYHDSPTWIDELSIPLTGIVGYADRLRRDEEIARPQERLQAEAEELIEQHRSALDGDARVTFDRFLKVARTVLPFTQDHGFYGEHWFLSIFWRKMRDLGATLAAADVFDDPEDVFYLHRHEVGEAVSDAVLSWAIGARPVRADRTRGKVARRREIMDVLLATRPLPALGVPPEAITNPLLVSHVGVTTEVVQGWLAAANGEAVTGLHGTGASQGAVEGACRVVSSPDDLADVLPGEILVCQTTTPAWGPVFSRLGGLISDTGGMMSHSAVVAREYGFPAVVGCSGATSTLKTGDRVKIDGDRGAVSVLEAVAA